MEPIASATNPRFRRWRSLLTSRGIAKEGQALVSGPKFVSEVLKQKSVLEILLPEDRIGETLSPGPGSPRSFFIKQNLFNELDVSGTHSPLAVVSAPPIPLWEEYPPRGLELIVALSDPGNLGAVLRSAEAFGVSRVILAEESASPYLPRALRSAAGATWRLNLRRTTSLSRLDFANKEISYVGLDMAGEDLGQFIWPTDSYLVLGEEGRGLPAGAGLKTIRVPMAPTLESLNAVVAASIVMYAYRSKSGD